jgi:hypothetical protein
MLHERLIGRMGLLGAFPERRASPREPAEAEATIQWHHDPESLIRYDVVDISEDGLRIRASMMLPRGMSGFVLKLLPHGESIRRPVMVIWCNESEDGYEAGLRFI